MTFGSGCSGRRRIRRREIRRGPMAPRALPALAALAAMLRGAHAQSRLMADVYDGESGGVANSLDFMNLDLLSLPSPTAAVWNGWAPTLSSAVDGALSYASDSDLTCLNWKSIFGENAVLISCLVSMISNLRLARSSCVISLTMDPLTMFYCASGQFPVSRVFSSSMIALSSLWNSGVGFPIGALGMMSLLDQPSERVSLSLKSML